MKRKLIQQMCTEWRGNVWMMVELFIVAAVLWGIFSYFACLIHLRQPPKGVDLNDIYVGYIRTIPEDATAYTPYADEEHNIYTDLEMLLTRLRANENVEYAGTGCNALPYTYNYQGWNISVPVDTQTFNYMGNMRLMDSDMVRVIRLTGLNGESTEELAEMVGRGDILISTFEGEDHDYDPMRLRGHNAWIGNDTANIMHVSAVINGIRRTDYEPQWGGMMIKAFGTDYFPWEIGVRVKAGRGREFMENRSADELRFGNVYINDLNSLEKRRKYVNLSIDNQIRNLSAGALFVMSAIFLGFLGSFWYRTQQRVPELALRKVNGATDADLFRRLIGEGLLLLVIPVILCSVAACIFINKFDISIMGLTTGEIYRLAALTMLITTAVLALMIVAGVWMPARKAMKVNPAEALKDQ